jgi:hypothetical protein
MRFCSLFLIALSMLGNSAQETLTTLEDMGSGRVQTQMETVRNDFKFVSFRIAIKVLNQQISAICLTILHTNLRHKRLYYYVYISSLSAHSSPPHPRYSTLTMPPSTPRVITAFKLIMEKLVLARPLSEAKSSGRESRWHHILKFYEEELIRLEDREPRDALLTSAGALPVILRGYAGVEKEDAIRISKIASVQNYGNGSEEAIEAMIDLLVDLDVQSRG